MNIEHDLGYLKAQAKAQGESLKRVEASLAELAEFKQQTLASKKTLAKIGSAAGAVAGILAGALVEWIKS